MEGVCWLTAPPCPLGQPQSTLLPFPQVACPYVGCGESFADHSTIHAQVRVAAGARARRQAGSPEFKAHSSCLPAPPARRGPPWPRL